MTLEKVICKAMNMVGEYEKANEKIPYEMRERQSVNKKWSPPAVGYYKINSDAAVFGDNMIGLGRIMRDHLGDVMAATCCLQHGCFEVDIAKALAARHYLTIALDAGLRDIVLETDCSKLYQYLQHGKCETSAFGVIVSDILLLASYFSSISISQVGRDGNCVAHLLARGSIEFGKMRVWLEEVPHCACNVVLLDLTRYYAQIFCK